MLDSVANLAVISYTVMVFSLAASVILYSRGLENTKKYVVAAFLCHTSFISCAVFTIFLYLGFN